MVTTSRGFERALKVGRRPGLPAMKSTMEHALHITRRSQVACRREAWMNIPRSERHGPRRLG
jgi:hypothetical protein